jgi:hypothetical protein
MRKSRAHVCHLHCIDIPQQQQCGTTIEKGMATSLSNPQQRWAGKTPGRAISPVDCSPVAMPSPSACWEGGSCFRYLWLIILFCLPKGLSLLPPDWLKASGEEASRIGGPQTQGGIMLLVKVAIQRSNDCSTRDSTVQFSVHAASFLMAQIRFPASLGLSQEG